MDTVIYISKKDEREFVDWIFDRMYEKSIHCGVEFANFTLNFDGSEDIKDQADWMADIMKYMKHHTTIPCLVTMTDVATRISAIEVTHYKDEESVIEEPVGHDNHLPLPNIETTENNIADYDQVEVTLVDKPVPATEPAEEKGVPEDLPDDEVSSNGPTFQDLFNYFEENLYEDTSSNHIHSLGKFNTMLIPSSSNDNRRYAFSNKETDQVHYMVFENDAIAGLQRITLSNTTDNWVANPEDTIDQLLKKVTIHGTADLLRMFIDLLK